MMNKQTALAPAETIKTPALAARTNQRELAGAWYESLQNEVAAGLRSERTADAYKTHAGHWLNWLDRNAVAVPTPAHVMAYVASLRAGHAPATVNAHLAAVRNLYAWAETQNAFPAVARSVKSLPVRKDEPLECLTPEQVAGLLDLVDGNALGAMRDRALLQVLFSTALRLVSLTAANVEDFDPLDAVLKYTGKGDRGNKGRRAYLSPSALDALRRYLSARRAANGGDLAAGAPLFSANGNRAGGERLTARSVRRVIVGLMEKAGHIRRDEAGRIVRPRVYSAHSLRRSALTAAYDCAGLDAAQTLAGHADPATTRRHYARVQKGKVLKQLAGALDLGRLAATEQTEKGACHV